ncbi:hybrid sensor histidine kinase/response regulator transcription factor [Lunatibacter salilacus]|uniref:hybrid sensor histidine kinase/response regulator transcription factor n=1 Tax=Lunatibacter salilacus TaxID=2483804 RepID=UPI001F2A9F2A|nr:two-component regulator propeller domain-containing protein [Lunatibacter salilacus]
MGRVFVASSFGLFVIADESLTPRLIFHQDLFEKADVPSSSVQCVYEDKDGYLWLGSEIGLFQTKLKIVDQYNFTLEFENAFFNGPQGTALNDENITAIQEVGENEYWIGTKNGGINIYDQENHTFSYLTVDSKSSTCLADNEIRSILKDRNGGYWVGTFKGLSYFSENKECYQFLADQDDPNSISHNSIRSIYQDKNGGIWIGTYFGGANIYYPHHPNFENYTYSSYTNSISHQVVSCIAETDSNKIWIGTDGGGLNLLDRKTGFITSFVHDPSMPNSLSHNSIKTLELDKEGNLWVGTYLGGLNLLKKDADKFIQIKNEPSNPHSLSDNSIYAIEEDKDGGIWFGTHGGGLNYLQSPESNEFILYNTSKNIESRISSDYVRCLLMDSQENLWVGTENGVNVKWRGENKFEVFRFSLSDSTRISGDMVVSIFEDKSRRIWIGTYSNGLNLFEPKNKKFTHFSSKDGLPGNNIFGITEDMHGNLWLSTNNGISKFNPGLGLVKNYEKMDGIIGNEFVVGSYASLKGGEIAFGSSQGLTIFHPDSLKTNLFRPPVVMTDLKLFNKSVMPQESGLLKQHISETESITLSHSQNIFTVDFAVLNYMFPDKNQYAFKLEGFEDDWNYVNHPSATYTNLNAGNYTLFLKGANNDGVWNEKPTILKIKVLPPPWKTWWAYTIYGCIVLGSILILLNFIKIRTKLEHDLQLEHLEKLRQDELNEVKLNFFTNISHEFRTPLTLILTPIQQLIKENTFSEEGRFLLNTVKDNANRLLKLVNQLMDFRKQESGLSPLKISSQNIVEMVEDVTVSFSYYSRKNKISLIFTSIENNIEVFVDRDLIEKVIVNLLSNAFKYTAENGKIVVALDKGTPTDQYVEGYVKINVSDNGVGIPPNEIDKIFESFYQAGNLKGNSSGSGLGLALAKSIVNSHGGEIYAKSLNIKAKEIKTTFTVILPLGTRQLDSNPSFGGVSEENYQRDKGNIEGMIDVQTAMQCFPNNTVLDINQPKTIHEITILVVEDNNDLRRIIVNSLNSYNILEAQDGEKGWVMAQKSLPDIVISDVMMPNRDGISLLGLIKGDIQTNHIPVILLTAKSSHDNMVLGLESGSDDYITKPFQLEILKLKVANIIRNRDNFKKKFMRDYLLHPTLETQESPISNFLRQVVEIIEINVGEDDFNVNRLAHLLGLSRPVLYRKLKQLTDLNVIEIINRVRLKKASLLLCEREATIADVAYRVGFSDPKYFSKSFKLFFGKSPREFMAESENGTTMKNESTIL